MKPRRIAAAASPYSRPLPPVPENPNWFTGLINPATRIIATGASKIISSVFGSDSSSSSSTSSDNSGSRRFYLLESLCCVGCCTVGIGQFLKYHDGIDMYSRSFIGNQCYFVAIYILSFSLSPIYIYLYIKPAACSGQHPKLDQEGLIWVGMLYVINFDCLVWSRGQARGLGVGVKLLIGTFCI